MKSEFFSFHFYFSSSSPFESAAANSMKWAHTNFQLNGLKSKCYGARTKTMSMVYICTVHSVCICAVYGHQVLPFRQRLKVNTNYKISRWNKFNRSGFSLNPHTYLCTHRDTDTDTDTHTCAKFVRQTKHIAEVLDLHGFMSLFSMELQGHQK